MRRLLPLFLCVAASTGLTGCDDQPVTGPTNTDEQALYDFLRAANHPAPGILSDGGLTLTRYDRDPPEPVIVVVLDTAAIDADGEVIQVYDNDTISSPDGQVQCTKGTSGPFTQLLDTDGTVLLSVMGPWVFDGAPDLSGNAGEQYNALMSSLRFSYSLDLLVDGMPSTGDTVLEASAPMTLASPWEKARIAALADDYCL